MQCEPKMDGFKLIQVRENSSEHDEQEVTTQGKRDVFQAKRTAYVKAVGPKGVYQLAFAA